MRRISFLHCSDIHLDMPFRYLGDREKAIKRRKDLLEVFDHIVETAAEREVDLLLVSGDLYEHEYTSRSSILHARDRFAGINGTEVVLLPGNHDPHTSNSFYSTLNWPENVHILSADKPILDMREMGATLLGLGWESDISEGLNRIRSEPVNRDRINILLFHGTVDMLFSKNAFNSVNSRDIGELGMDYVAVGHFHKSFSGLGPGKNIYNPGSPEPLAFDQSGGEHGVFCVDLARKSDGRISRDVEFISTGKRKYHNIDIRLDGTESVQQIKEIINGCIANTGGPEDLYRIVLKGHVEDGLGIDTAALEKDLSEKVFFADVINRTVPSVDFETALKLPGIKGIFAARIFDRISTEDDEGKKRIFERALRFGLQALDEGKVDMGD